MSVQRKWIALGVIALLGAFIRFSYPDLVEVGFSDEITYYHTIMLMLDGKNVPTGGPNYFRFGTQGVVPGGFFYYLCAPAYLISKHPAAGVVLLAVLNFLAMFVVYALGKRMFSERAGLIASLLFTVSPWMFLCSRKFWHKYYAIFFAMVFLYCMWRWITDREPKYLIVIFPLMAIIVQLHTAFIVVGLFFILAFIVYRPPLSVWTVLVGIVAGLAMYGPFLVSEFGSGFAVVRSYLTPSAYHPSGGFHPDSLKAIIHPFILASGEMSLQMRGDTLPFYGFPSFFFILTFASIVLIIGTLLFAYGSIIKASVTSVVRGGLSALQRNTPASALTFLVLYVLSFVIVNLVRYNEASYARYFAIAFPVNFLIIAAVFSGEGVTQGRITAFLQRFRTPILAGIAAVQCMLIQQYLYTMDRGLMFSGDAQVNVRHHLEACRYILASSKSNYVIVNDEAVTEPWRQYPAGYERIEKFGDFMRFYLGVQPSTNADRIRYIYVHGPTAPQALLSSAVEYRRFSWFHIFRMNGPTNAK